MPIIPITVSGTQRITPKGQLRSHAGRVKIRYGKPIPTRGVAIADRKLLEDARARRDRGGYDVAYQGSIVIDARDRADARASA